MDNLNVFVGVTSAAVVLQTAILGGMYFSMRKTRAKMEAIADEVRTKTLPVIEHAQTLLIEVRPQVNNILDNVNHSSRLVRGHIERLDATVNDALDRATGLSPERHSRRGRHS